MFLSRFSLFTEELELGMPFPKCDDHVGAAANPQAPPTNIENAFDSAPASVPSTSATVPTLVPPVQRGAAFQLATKGAELLPHEVSRILGSNFAMPRLPPSAATAALAPRLKVAAADLLHY